MTVVMEDFPGPNSGSRGRGSGSAGGDGMGVFCQERPSRSSNSILVSLKVLSSVNSTFCAELSIKANVGRKSDSVPLIGETLGQLHPRMGRKSGGVRPCLRSGTRIRGGLTCWRSGWTCGVGGRWGAVASVLPTLLYYVTVANNMWRKAYNSPRGVNKARTAVTTIKV